jgi:uncharacterized phage protein (TIGR01671 family)
MREIKFRGKITNTDEWVYGQYVDWSGHKHANFRHQIYCLKGSASVHLVMKNTIGQYTGLKDKNDTEIYDGDVVKCIMLSPASESIGVVKWDKNKAIYYFDGEMPDCHIPRNTFLWISIIEVIGNIHDTPELLEGDGNE